MEVEYDFKVNVVFTGSFELILLVEGLNLLIGNENGHFNGPQVDDADSLRTRLNDAIVAWKRVEELSKSRRGKDD